MGRDLRSVAVYAPMKRGLKAQWERVGIANCLCCSLCPDEKGTESVHINTSNVDAVVAVYAPMKRGLKDHYPDRERRSQGVAVYAPMKRGLKVEIFANRTRPLLKLQSMPR